MSALTSAPPLLANMIMIKTNDKHIFSRKVRFTHLSDGKRARFCIT